MHALLRPRGICVDTRLLVSIVAVIGCASLL
jgi:hypothetical protein